MTTQELDRRRPAAGEAKRSPGPGQGRGPRRSKGWLRLIQVAVFAAIVAAWWLVTELTDVSPVVLPSPYDVGRELVTTNLCTEQANGQVGCGVQGYFLWQHLLATLERIGVGLIAGTILGVLLGWALGSNPTVRRVVEPYLSFLRALPPLGYIGLLIVWFGIGDTSKVVLLFLAVFPTVTVSTISGVIGVPNDWTLAARTLGASRGQIFQRILIPAALPEIINGVRLATALAWSAIVAAEMNDGIPGIGGLAFVSGTQLNTSLTIACIVVIGLVALVIDHALLYTERRFAPWRRKG